MRMLSSRKPLALAMTLTGSALVATNVSAQPRLEEIVITAQKREQTLQEVPVAVSVVGVDVIEQTQIQDLVDLQVLVPSLRINQLNTTAGVDFKIRGFGNGATQPGIEPSVGIFIDGVFRPRSASALQDLLNVERVEVLRGPQTTLFGKNASAGVVSVVTKKPSNEHEAMIEATVDDYDARILKGYWSGPLVDDTLLAGLSGSYAERDGYADIVDGNGNKVGENNDRDRWSLRADLVWTPSDDLSFRLAADYGEIDEICCNAPYTELGPTAPIIQAFGGYLSDDPFDYEAPSGTFPQNEITEEGIALHVDWYLDNFTFTSITAQRETDSTSLHDGDQNTTDIAGDVPFDRVFETFTQEFRLTSNGDGNLDWLVGAFYLDETLTNEVFTGYGAQTRDYLNLLLGAQGQPTADVIEALLGLPPGSVFANNTGLHAKAEQEGESLTFFGQVDWHVTETVTLTGGINYTAVDKDVTYEAVTTDALAPFGLSPVAIFNPRVNLPNAVEDNESDDEKTTWLARVSWDLSDSMSMYASAATGYKATSWDLHIDSAPIPEDMAALVAAGLAPPTATVGTRLAEPEEVIVYELGFKSQWDNLVVNAAIFDQSFTDFQTATFTGTGFILGNADEQSVQGLELETTWYPLDSLQLSLAVTYLDAEYDEYNNAPGRDGASVVDLSGETPSGIPEWAGVASAVYSHTFNNGWDGFLRADYVFEDEHIIADNLPERFTREVSTFNMSAGLYFTNGWSAQIWGRNLNDDEYLSSVYRLVLQPESYGGYPNAPKSYGLTVRKSFF